MGRLVIRKKRLNLMGRVQWIRTIKMKQLNRLKIPKILNCFKTSSSAVTECPPTKSTK